MGGAKAFTTANAELGDVPVTRFSEVVGCDEAVEELAEIVTFLHQPERFAAAGARMPRGFLLVGPPGTGKTLLARAVAGEAGVPFYAVAGSDFTEMFVGVGAARVRNLFAKAKKTGGIIFLDELDSIGRARTGTTPGSGGTDEREVDPQRPAGRDGRLRQGQQRHRHRRHQPARRPRLRPAAGRPLRPPGRRGPARPQGPDAAPRDLHRGSDGRRPTSTSSPWPADARADRCGHRQPRQPGRPRSGPGRPGAINADDFAEAVATIYMGRAGSRPRCRSAAGRSSPGTRPVTTWPPCSCPKPTTPCRSRSSPGASPVARPGGGRRRDLPDPLGGWPSSSSSSPDGRRRRCSSTATTPRERRATSPPPPEWPRAW